MSVLVIAEHDNASLHSATLHTVTAAGQLDGVGEYIIRSAAAAHDHERPGLANGGLRGGERAGTEHREQQQTRRRRNP